MRSENSTAHFGDACLREGVPLRCVALTPVVPSVRVAGRARVVRHFGSVNVFLEAIERSSPGEVLVVANAARLDEACVGDLIALEAKAAAFSGIVIWGRHRDTADILRIGMPVFSLGPTPAGPERLDPHDGSPFGTAEFGGFLVSDDDYVVADDDGVIFLPLRSLQSLTAAADGIRQTETRQAERVAEGATLRAQFHFADYLALRATDPDLTFRRHLRSIRASIEE